MDANATDAIRPVTHQQTFFSCLYFQAADFNMNQYRYGTQAARCTLPK